MAIAEAELSQLHKKQAKVEVRAESLQQREQQLDSKQQEIAKMTGKQHEQELRELLEREKNQAKEERIRSLEEERRKLEALMSEKDEDNAKCLQTLKHCTKRAEEKVMKCMLNYLTEVALKMFNEVYNSILKGIHHIKELNTEHITDA